MNIKEVAEAIALGSYCGEPYRICGVPLEPEDMNTAVFAGYSADCKSRSAHGDCWNKLIPKERWAHPEDDDSGK